MAEHVVASEGEIPDGDRLIIEINGLEICVMHQNGEYYAFLNWCPHQAGPVCEGKLTGTVEATFDKDTLTTSKEWERDGNILVCPWHRWEFDITTGDCLSREDVVLPSYPVTVDDTGDVIVSL